MRRPWKIWCFSEKDFHFLFKKQNLQSAPLFCQTSKDVTIFCLMFLDFKTSDTYVFWPPIGSNLFDLQVRYKELSCHFSYAFKSNQLFKIYLGFCLIPLDVV